MEPADGLSHSTWTGTKSHDTRRIAAEKKRREGVAARKKVIQEENQKKGGQKGQYVNSEAGIADHHRDEGADHVRCIVWYGSRQIL